MHIDILAAVPDILQSPLNNSILGRAQKNKVVTIEIHDIREFTQDKHKRIDDYAYSKGAGMVLRIEPVFRAIEYLKSKRNYDEIIYTSPDGENYNQKMANHFSTFSNLLILCGHYKGIDQRIRDYLITKEISIGDYVLTGGELAAATMVDSIVRLIPGAMGDETSALTDSYQDNLLAPPVYTRPAEFNGWKVPDILLSGNEAKIEEWKSQKAIERTKKLRPGLLQNE